MRFYQTPLKNPSAATLSFLMGLVTIAAIILSLRVADSDQLSQKAEPIIETVPIDPKFPEIQRVIRDNREQKLSGIAPAKEKTVTETKPVQTTITVPAPKAATPSTTQKKSDRTTKTS